nr:unnamed protein product [Callosobruchus analis]
MHRSKKSIEDHVRGHSFLPCDRDFGTLKNSLDDAIGSTYQNRAGRITRSSLKRLPIKISLISSSLVAFQL